MFEHLQQKRTLRTCKLQLKQLRCFFLYLCLCFFVLKQIRCCVTFNTHTNTHTYTHTPQGEPEFDRLKRELEEVKQNHRGLDGTYRSQVCVCMCGGGGGGGGGWVGVGVGGCVRVCVYVFVCEDYLTVP